jgi:hypothetical protein
VLDGISAAEQITARGLAPVVILTAFSQRDLVQRASNAGAMAYLVKPFTKAELIPAIEIAVSRFAELSALQSEISDLRERLAMRKLLDRAKGVLQVTQGMTEPEAFRWIQKTSMDRRMTMRALAQEILDIQAAASEGAAPGGTASGGTGPEGAVPAAAGPAAPGTAAPGTAAPRAQGPGGAGPGAATAKPGAPGPRSTQPRRPRPEGGAGSAGPGPDGTGQATSTPDS